MVEVQTWSSVLTLSFQSLWYGFVQYVPNLVIAIVLFLIGVLLAAGIAKIVEQIIKSIKLDHALKAAGLEDLMEKGGFRLNSSAFFGEIVRWFIVLVFLIASLEVLGLSQITIFLQNVVLGYLPQVISAVLILVIAVIVADVVRKIVVGAAKAASIRSANFLGSLSKWAIWIPAFLAALLELGIATGFIQTLFTGVVVALALAFGLSFGLGGRDAAASYIEKLKEEISNHRG